MVMSKTDASPSKDTSIAEVIARVRAGDQAAARELIAQTRQIVGRIARSNLPRRSTEEDLVQEVYLKIFSRLGQYRGDAPFEHWVSRVAVTTCVNQLRAQRRRPELRMADLSSGEALMLEATVWDPHERLPGEAFAARELLVQLLARLRPEDRMLVVWFELEERTIADIEALTGWNSNFIKMRLFRARRKLKRCFAAFSGFDGPESGLSARKWQRTARAAGNPPRSERPRRCAGSWRESETVSRGPNDQRSADAVIPLPIEAALEVA